jgi:hypothetical protein
MRLADSHRGVVAGRPARRGLAGPRDSGTGGQPLSRRERGRAFFDTRVPGPGSSYRVAVRSFDVMTDGEWPTRTTEQLPATEGFQKKLAHLQTITPARRLLARPRDGQLFDVYADPAVCRCLYVGTAQYQRVLDKRLENEQLQAGQE